MSGDFATVRAVGGLLPPDLLRRIAAGDPELGLLAPSDYGLRSGDRLGEAIARAWARAKAYWLAFGAATSDLPPADRGTTPTRDQWLLPLLRELGYGDVEFRPAAEEIGGRRFPIAYRSGGLPLHLVSFRQGLDEPELLGTGRRVPPHALLQDYLNLSDATYGLVGNGRLLRLLRKKASLTLQPYVEFDLEGMLEGGIYADFVLLYLVLHRTRLTGAAAEQACPLDQWRAKAELQGTRARDQLRLGVEQAIVELGRGFLAHPANAALRQRLDSGELTDLGFYAQLLRLVYRLIFLFAAEERDLLFPADAEARARAIYDRHYAASRLRDLAPKLRDDERHDDLFRGFMVTCRLLRGDHQGKLAVPALGGGLFDTDSCPDLAGAQLDNARFARALVQLSSVYAKEERLPRRVNYRDMDAEELGGVYEGLLERQPRVEGGAFPTFALVGSGQRKQTGSYYTPTALVEELITSALEPVLADRQRGARDEASRRDTILGITVCDPACGSGHFLLAAARRLARELARVEAGDEEPTPPLLRRAQREVIRRCLYGVDSNPLAVDLCKLALWLEGQEPGLPLTFLDHRIRLGNSLIGTTPELVAGLLPDGTEREPGLPDEAFAPLSGDDRERARGFARVNRQERRNYTVREADGAWAAAEERLAAETERITRLPERRLVEVREQRAAYEALEQGQRETARAALDAWCAAFFWPLPKDGPEPPTTSDLRAAGPDRPPALDRDQQTLVRQLRERRRFFHWPLEFPEVFRRGGFDVVLGNPPWERIKLQEKEFFEGRDRAIAKAPNKAARDRLIRGLQTEGPGMLAEFEQAKTEAEGESKFVRASGRFPLSAVKDVNLYSLFAEHDWRLLNPGGRAGIIVQTGIATDDSTKRLFSAIVESGALASLFDFENRRDIFAGVGHGRFKFCLMTLSGNRLTATDMAFMLTDVAQLADAQRRFRLTPDDFALLNPNTRTCPIFRTGADAELTRAISRRVPVLVDERSGANAWGVSFLRMFDMSNDSHLFHDAPGPGRLPLYEAKLFHQFTHRYGTYAGRAPGSEDSELPRPTGAQLRDPSFAVTLHYWVEAEKVEEKLRGRWTRGWLLAFRDVARNTDERTAIFSVLPRVGVNHKAPLLLPTVEQPGFASCLLANFDSLVFDYLTRQKLGGTSLGFFILRQLPAIPPTAYTSADLDFIVPRVLELVYTAWDMQPFARDVGYEGPPFAWDGERRALLRAELDACYAALYGLTREELRYVLDPSDVYGPDFPGETFRVMKERETKQYGEYRTRRLVLEAWDRLELAPRNREGRYATGEPHPLAPSPARRGGTGGGRPVEARGVQESPRATYTARQAALFPDTTRPSLFEAADDEAGETDAPAAGAQAPALPSATPSGRSAASAPLPHAELRRLVLRRATELLERVGPLTALELAARLAALDERVTKYLVANVLQTAGAARVGFDGKAQRYFLKGRRP